MNKKEIEKFVQRKSKGTEISELKQRIIINYLWTKVKFSDKNEDINLEDLFIKAVLALN